MKRAIMTAILLFIGMSMACTHYTTAIRPDPENVINAPIDIVWETVLQVVPTERITLKTISKEDYFIAGRKHITFWSWGDDISIRLIPKSEKQTIIHIGAGTKAQLVDWGHEKRMVKHIFDRIKSVSENKITPKD